jgi:hypothetical protein
MKSKVVAFVVVLAAFVLGYAAGGTGLRAQVPSTMGLAFSAGDTVRLRLAGFEVAETCVVEGFASGFVNCQGEQPTAYNLAQVVRATVIERAPR